MAEPKVENGYTMLANEIVDQFPRLNLSSNDWRVLWVIIRKTYGFHKKVDRIANSQIVEATGLCKTVVSRSIKKLQVTNVIVKNGKTLGFQKNYELWSGLAEKLAESSTMDIKLAELQTKVSSPAVTPKKGSPKGDHRIKEILDKIEEILGQQIPFYGKEGAAVKRALAMGFTPEEILGCWEMMRGFEFWQGKWLPLHKVTENLGEYKGGRLSDGKKPRRVSGGREASEFTSHW